MPPERAHGQPGGAPADLWGLGASLYTAVEGRPPFERPGALATLTAVVTDEPDPFGHAGPLEPVISGLLGKDPGTRLGPADAERMLQDVLKHATGARTAPMTGPGPGPAATSEPAPPEPETDTESLPPGISAPAAIVVIPPAPAAARVPGAVGPPGKPAAPVPQRPPPVRLRGRRGRSRGLRSALIAVLAIAAIAAAVSSALPPDVGPPDGPPTAQDTGQVIGSRLAARVSAGLGSVRTVLTGPGRFIASRVCRRERDA